jgi:hypothetical protein
MNESGDYIVNCDYTRNCRYNGWFSQPETKHLCVYNYNKHYTSCLMRQDLVFEWPLCSVYYEVKTLGGDIEKGFIVSTLICLLFTGAG